MFKRADGGCLHLQADDSLKGMELLIQKLQNLLCPGDSSISDLLQVEQVYLRPAESEQALHKLDRANVELANALQRLVQVRRSA